MPDSILQGFGALAGQQAFQAGQVAGLRSGQAERQRLQQQMFANVMGLAQAQQQQANWQSRFNQQNQQFAQNQAFRERGFQAGQDFKERMFQREGERYQGQLEQQRQQNQFRMQGLEMQREGLQLRQQQAEQNALYRQQQLALKNMPKPLSPSQAKAVAELESTAYGKDVSSEEKAAARSALQATGRPVFGGELDVKSRRAGLSRVFEFPKLLPSLVNPYGESLTENLAQTVTGISGKDLQAEMSELHRSIAGITQMEKQQGRIPEALRLRRDEMFKRYEELKGTSGTRGTIFGATDIPFRAANIAADALGGMFDRPSTARDQNVAAGFDPSIGLY